MRLIIPLILGATSYLARPAQAAGQCHLTLFRGTTDAEATAASYCRGIEARYRISFNEGNNDREESCDTVSLVGLGSTQSARSDNLDELIAALDAEVAATIDAEADVFGYASSFYNSDEDTGGTRYVDLFLYSNEDCLAGGSSENVVLNFDDRIPYGCFDTGLVFNTRNIYGFATCDSDTAAGATLPTPGTEIDCTTSIYLNGDCENGDTPLMVLTGSTTVSRECGLARVSYPSSDPRIRTYFNSDGRSMEEGDYIGFRLNMNGGGQLTNIEYMEDELTCFRDEEDTDVSDADIWFAQCDTDANNNKMYNGECFSMSYFNYYDIDAATNKNFDVKVSCSFVGDSAFSASLSAGLLAVASLALTLLF